MVCKRPYSNQNDCYNLSVTNLVNTLEINFPNGGYIKLDDIYCTETVYDEGICQGIDADGNTWDILEINSSL